MRWYELEKECKAADAAALICQKNDLPSSHQQEGSSFRRSSIGAGSTLEKSIMNELVKLRQQIAEMEKQAAELQKKSRPAVLVQLREQMAAYGITTDELNRPIPKASRSKAPQAKPASSPKGKKPVVHSPIKYRGPEGQEWSGRGTAPKWLKDLLADGKTPEDFLIRPGAPASSQEAKK